MTQQGLRQRIATATDTAEITSLLVEGKGYQFASDNTRRTWASTAARRKASLTGQAAPKVEAPVEQEIDLKAVAKKKAKKKAATA